MNRRLSKKQKWFKEIVLTEEDELYVALDVHKTPGQSAPDSKSDRLDSRQLAEYASKGLFKPVFIPTEQREGIFIAVFATKTVSLGFFALAIAVLSHFDNMHKFFNKQKLQENGVIYDLAIKPTEIHRCPPHSVSGHISDFSSCL